MSLELIKESVRVNHVIGELSTQTIIENDIIVPDSKSDVESILYIDGQAVVNNVDVLQDKVHIRGVVFYNILYNADDGNSSIRSINTKSEFSCYGDVENVRQGMKCKIESSSIEHIDEQILNSRKINVRTIINIAGKVTNEEQKEIVSEIKGVENIQTLRNLVNINCYFGESEVNLPVKDIFEVSSAKPAIKEILRNDIKIANRDFKLENNGIVIRGQLNVSTLYIGDDEEQSIQYMENDIPFTHMLETLDIDENGDYDLRISVIDYNFEALEDSDGEPRNINAEIILSITAEGYYKRSIDVIDDAYSMNLKLNFRKENFNNHMAISENKVKFNLNERISLCDENEQVEEVYSVICRSNISNTKVNNNKLEIEGIATFNVLYSLDTQQSIRCYQHEIPIKHEIDMDNALEDMDSQIVFDLEQCSFNFNSSREIEVKADFGIHARVIEKSEVQITSEVNEVSIDERNIVEMPSLIIYYSQVGDTLWRIAKKYGTTVDEIKEINGISDEDEIINGRQFIIQKKTV